MLVIMIDIDIVSTIRLSETMHGKIMLRSGKQALVGRRVTILGTATEKNGNKISRLVPSHQQIKTDIVSDSFIVQNHSLVFSSCCIYLFS